MTVTASGTGYQTTSQSLTLNADGSFSLTPGTSFTGTATFQYILTDGNYTSPAGDFGALTKNLTTGTFTYKTPEQATINFNSDGTQSSAVSGRSASNGRRRWRARPATS